MISKVKGKANLIKEVNKNKIINILVNKTELTKFEIAKKLDMSIPTVSTNINKLKEEGLVEEIDSDIYTGGRKPKIIKLNPNKRVSFGVNLSQDKIEIVVMNLEKKILIKTIDSINIDSFKGILLTINDMINNILIDNKIDESSVVGIGISVPGIINKKREIIEYTNIGISNIDLTDYEDIFKFDTFYENEANVSVLAERSLDKYKKFNNLIYLSINEGLGGAVILNDSLYRGSNGRSGEFGHVKISPESEDTIEHYLSTKNIIKKYNKLNPKKHITDFKQFEEKVYENDIEALGLMDKVLEILSKLLCDLTMSFDPDVFIIGGEFSTLINKFNEKLNGSSCSDKDVQYEHSVEIYYCENKSTSVRGAAILPIENYLELDLVDIR